MAWDIFRAYAIRPYTGTCKIWRVSYFRTRIHQKTHPISSIPIRIRTKPTRFYTQTFGERHFRSVCNTPLHGCTQNQPDFRPKPSARSFWGRMQYAPTRVHQNQPGFIPKSLARDISGRMQYAPTRVHAKIVRFHISVSGHAKNAPDFTLPNRDTPKIRPILGTNRRRGYLRGVCNMPLHGYVQNLAGFIFPHTTWRETRRVLDFANDMAQNPTGFGLCHTTWRKTRRVLDFATRHSAKPGGFWTLPLDIARNPAGFSHCHTFE